MNISSENIQLQIASLRGEIISTLIGITDGEESASFADIFSEKSSALSADGRNNSLRDPEAAYGMMTKINQFEVMFKAQYAELDAMGENVEQMEAVGEQLGAAVDTSSSNADILAQLQAFVDQYNAWEDRFDDTVAQGGVLENVFAAQVSLYELENNFKDRFNGAAEGIRGMEDLGIVIDPVTKQAHLDVARVEAQLVSNKSGVVAAIDSFSANFARSADLLNSAGNFIPTQLDNRSRAIDYIASHRTSLEAEFGTGDAASPSGATAKALAAYNAASAL